MKFHPPNRNFSLAYRKFLYHPMGRSILLLTSTGRRTGKPHTIGLQYELIEGRYYVGAADGIRADWVRNILKNSIVELQVGAKKFAASARVVTDCQESTKFLEYRYYKRKLMMRIILRMDGLKGRIDYTVLEQYATRIGLVILTPTAA
jgi:deazaflavin-dependent oxidoreductase (nitroreductase family)